MNDYLKILLTVASCLIIACTMLLFYGILGEPKEVVDSVAGGFCIMLLLSVFGSAWLIYRHNSKRKDAKNG